MRGGKRRLAKKRRKFIIVNRIIYTILTSRGGMSLLNIGLLKSLLYTCIFAADDGSCALQKISQDAGLYKWYYKPVNCWKYPIGIRDGLLILLEERHNRHFPCNCDCERPAYENLQEELSFLSRIIGRDLVSEIKEAQ